MKQRKYRRINEVDRNKIEALYNAHVPVKQIAEELGFSKVSIYAELKRGAYQHRNTDWTETTKYSAYKAQRNANYNATAKGAPLKIGNDYKFAKFVEKMIRKGYSPEAILGYIKDHKLEFKTKVCRVTLYSYISKGIFQNVTNKSLLRKSKKAPAHDGHSRSEQTTEYRTFNRKKTEGHLRQMYLRSLGA